METNWIERIGAELHQAWMDFRVETMGMEEAQKHKHFTPWRELHSAEGGVETMDQDRFVASLVLLAFAQTRIPDCAALAPLIHNSLQLWIRLTGEKLQVYHVPYGESDNPAINEWMKKERTMQAGRVWPILHEIPNIEHVRNYHWIDTL
jgi:hypothetical protein